MNTQGIIKDVARIYGVDMASVMSRKRHREFADVRTIVFYVMCDICKMSYSEAGRHLHRTHADVIYHVGKARDWLRMPLLNERGAKAIRSMMLRYGRKSA